MEEYIEALMEVQPENLKPEAKQLFDVIMRVIDERDEYKQRIDKIFSRITLWKMEDITMETARVLDDLLKVVKGDSNG